MDKSKKNIAETVQQMLKNAEGGHDWLHINRVYKNAMQIYNKEKKGDLYILQLAALLHDIADAKFNNGDEAIASELALKVMLGNSVPENVINEVIKIIENMSYRSRYDNSGFTSIEMDIVRDADMLDALGAIGIARAFNYGGFKNRPLYDPEGKPQKITSKDQYIRNDGPTIHHFFEKLIKLKDLMQTETGKEMAKERHEYLVTFINQFYDDIGEDKPDI